MKKLKQIKQIITKREIPLYSFLCTYCHHVFFPGVYRCENWQSSNCSTFTSHAFSTLVHERAASAAMRWPSAFREEGWRRTDLLSFSKLPKLIFSTPQFLLFEFKLAKLLFNTPAAVAARVDPLKAVCSVAFDEV